MLEALFEFLGELFIQILAELLVQSGIRSLTKGAEPAYNPFEIAAGVAGGGAVCGAISVWVLPSHLIQDPELRLWNLAITPSWLALRWAELARCANLADVRSSCWIASSMAGCLRWPSRWSVS